MITSIETHAYHQYMSLGWGWIYASIWGLILKNHYDHLGIKDDGKFHMSDKLILDYIKLIENVLKRMNYGS